MASDEDSVSKILSVIAHPLRREILTLVSEKSECSFTDLLNMLQVDTGKLSFHLRTLSAFLDQTSNGKYVLNRTGESAIRVIADVQSWAEVADIQRKAEQLPLAPFKKRAYAFLMDFVIIFSIPSLLALPQFIPIVFGKVFSLDLAILPLITMVLIWIYSTLLEGFNGQTLGKRRLGLKVVRTDGKKITYDQAGIRNFGKAFLLVFDLLAGLKYKKRFLRYFDKFAGSTVIDLRAQTS